MDLYCCYFTDYADRIIKIVSDSVNLSVSCSLMMNVTATIQNDIGGGAIYLYSPEHLVLYQNIFSNCLDLSDTGGQAFRIIKTKTKKIIGISITNCLSEVADSLFVCDNEILSFQDNNISHNSLNNGCCGHTMTNGYMMHSQFIANNASKSYGLRSFSSMTYSRLYFRENNILSGSLIAYSSTLYLQDSILMNNIADCYFQKLGSAFVYIYNCTIDKNDTCQGFTFTNQKYVFSTLIIEHSIQCMTLNYRNNYHINTLFITPFIIL